MKNAWIISTVLVLSAMTAAVPATTSEAPGLVEEAPPGTTVPASAEPVDYPTGGGGPGDDLPLFVDESGDTMTGNLVMDNSDIQIQGGNLDLTGGSLNVADGVVKASDAGLDVTDGDLTVDDGDIALDDGAMTVGGEEVCVANTLIEGCAAEGDITAVEAGFGLSGGAQVGSASLSVDSQAVQERVTDSCAAGSSIRAIGSSGGVTCEPDDDSGGTVTQVDTGTGLTGGPITTSGTVSIANGGVTSTLIQNGAVSSSDLASSSVTSGKLAGDAVSSSKIQDGSVRSSDLSSGSVGSSELASGAVDSTHISSGAVGSSEISSSAVGSSEIASSAVDTGELASDAVTSSEVLDGSLSRGDLDFSVVGGRERVSGCGQSACLYTIDFPSDAFDSEPALVCSGHPDSNGGWNPLTCMPQAGSASSTDVILDSANPDEPITGGKTIHWIAFG